MYDCVWFTADKAEQAMALLAIPPESEWRERRGKMHPFRMWQNVYPPNVDGTARPNAMQCVAVDYQGSARLEPGGTKNGKLVIAQHLSEVKEIETGIIAATIKPETWERPEFQKTAASVERDEQAAKIKHANTLETEIAQQEKSLKQARRRYLVALATAGRINWRTSEQVLTDLAMIGQMEDAYEREIGLEDWLAHICPNRIQMPEDAPYDPVTFLEHAAKMFGMVTRREHIVSKGAA